jgi:hypothetical protein
VSSAQTEKLRTAEVAGKTRIERCRFCREVVLSPNRPSHGPLNEIRGSRLGSALGSADLASGEHWCRAPRAADTVPHRPYKWPWPEPCRCRATLIAGKNSCAALLSGSIPKSRYARYRSNHHARQDR